MVSSIALVLLALPTYWIYSLYSGLRKNIVAAKASNLPYVVIPVNVYATWWLMTSKLWIPLLRKFPSKWTEGWIDFAEADWPWRLLYEPLKKHGDVFLTVSPTSIFCWIASPEAISQVCARRDHFPKPLKDYKMLDIFGRNVVTTEGHVWKAHRKIISPTFNEKNNFMVFEETIHQTQQMLEKWTGPDGKGNRTLNEVPTDSMRLTLHIISKVGFGVKLLWPGAKQANGVDYGLGSHTPSSGHKLNFSDALSNLLERLFLVLVVPKAILKRLPWEATKEAYEAHHEWGIYMKELFDQKVIEARKGEKDQGMDMMGTLVRSSYGDSLANSPKETKKDETGKYVLSDSEIFGDAFVFIIAGHETTANSVHFSLMELAMVPACQRKLQTDIQSIFGSNPPQEWNYESSVTSMMGSMLGAVLNEELRLMPPVINIPKRCTDDSDQIIVIDDKKYIIPKGSNVNLNVVCVQRNPKYWPSLGPSKVTGATDDLDDFVPERWFVNHDEKNSNPNTNPDSGNASDEEDLTFGGPSGRDTSAQLFRPSKGAYIPFSEGARSCLGRRFAQVEVVTALAVIFQKYSVELAVDEWASDEQVAKMSTEEKKELYEKAMKEARRKIRGAETLITLKLQTGFIPVRVMKKGEERFLGLFE